jgi:hypothetical protein
MLTLRCSSLLAALCGCSVLAFAPAAFALSIEATATPFTGNDTEVEIILTEIDDGDIRVDVTVVDGVADLRGVFFNLADDSLLEGLEVNGDDVTDFVVGDVIDLGQGANLHGGGSPCPCDFGVEIGTPGIGKDAFPTTSFVISHETEDLALADFAEQLLGVRVTGVGDSNDRGGSAKLSVRLPEDPTPVPEPSTALLLVLGLGLLKAGGLARR